jgi:hypothetical protein
MTGHLVARITADADESGAGVDVRWRAHPAVPPESHLSRRTPSIQRTAATTPRPITATAMSMVLMAVTVGSISYSSDPEDPRRNRLPVG